MWFSVIFLACITPEDISARLDRDSDGYEIDEDCDDGDPSINPGSVETCNEIDDDCDGLIDADDEDVADAAPWFVDGDGDGFGQAPAGLGCGAPPEGRSLSASDCNDVVASIHPGAREECHAFADDDCDGLVDDEDPDLNATVWYPDVDGDGFGAANEAGRPWCSPPSGLVPDHSDCDDNDASRNPDATDVPSDGVDQDCNGVD